VEAARRGEGAAWQGLVQRLHPLVRRVAHGYRLDERDVEDVAQIVWLRLLEHLEGIREPRALPKWVMTTARRESLRLARGRARTASIDLLADDGVELPAENAEIDIGLLRSEEARAVRQGLAELPAGQRDLLLLLAVEPPLSYREISRILRMPLGSIGPTRARGLARLRTTAALRGYLGSARRTRPSGPCLA
jgi:RNA polymerase sigma factor (sigma-70 family)